MTERAGTPPKTLAEGPNAEAFQAFMGRADEGPVVMLNLLRFKPAGGAERYAKYMAAVTPHLRSVGGRVIYVGRPAELLIGHETWDSLILVEYPTRGAFVAMVTSPGYRAIQHLRDESLERSILYATNPQPTPAV